MSRIFINYRTQDQEATATLIERDLSRRFGSSEIFRASKSIGAGEDYEPAILRAVRRSDVLLAVIGPNWLEIRDPEGRRRIDARSDWTRREIAEAFANGVLVIPILVDGAPRIRAGDLPKSIRPLANCQYLRFSHRNAEADLDQIADAARTAAPELSEVPEPTDPGTPARQTNSVGDVHGTGIQAHDYTDRRKGVSGNITGRTIGTVIGESHGPVNTGHGAQYNAPQFHGDGTAYVAGDNTGGIRTDARGKRNKEAAEERDEDCT